MTTPRRCAGWVVVVMLLSLLGFVGVAHAGKVIPPGKEDTIRALLEPHALGEPVADAFVLHDMRIDRDAIVLSLQDATQTRSATLKLTTRDILFADHRVDGVAVVPGTGCMHAALRLGSQLCGREVARLRGLSFVAPLTVPGGATEVVLKGRTLTAAAPNRIPFEILDGGDAKICMKGELDTAAVTAPAPVDLFDLAASCTEKLKLDEVYELFDSAGLQYGPSFRTLRALRLGERELFAELHANLPDGVNAVACHPALIDGAFQAGGMLVLRRGTKDGADKAPFMPLHYAEATFYAPLPARVFCHGAMKPSASGSAILEFDVRLFDETGRHLVHFAGISLKRVPRAARLSMPVPESASFSSP